METEVVYVIGLVIALAFIVFGIDDLAWDIFSLFRGANHKRVDLALVNDKPPKMLAIVVAAWHEESVIGEVVDNLIASAQYPGSLYRVFLGVYPNDQATLAMARSLEIRHGGTVVAVVGAKPGPTSKADNINGTLRAIQAYERTHDVHFACVTIHDAEDVVHPNEFKMTNYLIDDYDALQFPVFPLQRMPRLRLFFKTLTSSTYADEFAEHHFRTLVMRDELGFVPSAGTGFVLSRRVLDSFGSKDVLPENSLTEDYQLSLMLRMQGFRVHYVLERVPRVNNRGRMVWDYIATRSLFPSTFKAAIRQKARWVYGITMQNSHVRDLFEKNSLTFAERVFLYKDIKAKYANFVLLPGYAALAYFLVQTLLPGLGLPVMYPLLSFSWWLCMLLFFMMVERQVVRARALINVYGWKTMAYSILLPPLFPIRLLWGNLINLVATFRAWKMRISFALSKYQKVNETHITAQKSKPQTKRPVWNKTDHEFLPEHVLVRYRRLLGDALLERRTVEIHHLEDTLRSAHPMKVSLGQKLLEQGFLKEAHITQAYALQQQSMFVEVTSSLVDRNLISCLPLELRNTKTLLPLVQSSEGWIIVIDDDIPPEIRVELAEKLDGAVFFLFSSTVSLRRAFEESGEAPSASSTLQEATLLLDKKAILLPQAGMALAYALHLNWPFNVVVREMGLAVSQWNKEDDLLPKVEH